jgi:hypothetical protein
MGYACQVHSDRRKIFAFDSYQGIPMASERDDQQPGVGYFEAPLPFVEDKRTLLRSSGVTVHALGQVRQNLSQWGLDLAQYELIEGWFQNTLPAVERRIDAIALLRLDGDLYESTRVCLEALHDKVSPGGYVIVDDYALRGCRDALHEYFAERGVSYHLVEIAGGGGPVYYRKSS